MKKITALLLAVLMSVSLLSSVAFAAEVPTGNSDVQAITLNPENLIPLDPPQYEASSLDVLPAVSDEQGIQAQANTVARVNPLYYDVYPVIIYEGEATVLKDTAVCIHRGPTPGMGYIDQTIKAADQNQVKSICQSIGYEVIGWYVYTAYEMINVFNPGYWNFYIMRENGDSNMMTANASLGINEFEIFTYVPTEPRAFRCGMRGTLTYRPQQDMDTATIPIGLYATFEAC